MTDIISIESNDLYIVRELLQLLLHNVSATGATGAQGAQGANIKLTSEGVLSANTIHALADRHHALADHHHALALALADHERMVQQLLLQMQYLEQRYKKSILYIHLDDISILNGNIFLFTSLQRAFPIQPTGKSILVYKPIRTEEGRDFFPPALTLALQKRCLPFCVPLAVNATSLGMFCAAILPQPAPPHSRLAYFIERCLTKGVRLYDV